MCKPHKSGSASAPPKQRLACRKLSCFEENNTTRHIGCFSMRTECKSSDCSHPLHVEPLQSSIKGPSMSAAAAPSLINNQNIIGEVIMIHQRVSAKCAQESMAKSGKKLETPRRLSGLKSVTASGHSDRTGRARSEGQNDWRRTSQY